MTIRAAAHDAAGPISLLGELGRWIASRLAVYLAAAVLSALLFLGWAFVYVHFWTEQGPSNEPPRFDTPLPRERPEGSPQSPDWALFAAERLDRAPIAKELVGQHVFPKDALKKKTDQWTVKNINECARKCQPIKNCVGFTFNAAQQRGHSCVLFGPTPEKLDAKGWISGKRPVQ